MILGMSVPMFTLLHVLISVVGLFSGVVVLVGLLKSSLNKNWTAVFLVTTVLTSVTGFFFHSKQIGPPHIVGLISLVILIVAVAALYKFRLAGPWRWVYVVTALMALYLNFFVAVVQSFQKSPLLHRLAPTQKEPPFLIVQLILLGIFVFMGVNAVKKFNLKKQKRA